MKAHRPASPSFARPCAMSSHGGALVSIVEQAHSVWQGDLQGDDSKKLMQLLLSLMNFFCLMLNVACCIRAHAASASKISASKISAGQESKTTSIWVSAAAQNRYHSTECHHVKRSMTMKRLELCADCANRERDKDE